MKINTKLIYVIEIAVLLSITISSLAAFQIGNRTIGDRMSTQLESAIISKRVQINTYFNERMDDVLSLSSSKDITGLLPLERTDYDREANLIDEKREKLQERLNLNKNFVEFLIIDKNGEVYLSTDKSRDGMLRTDSKYFIEGKKALYIDNPNYDISKSRSTVMISAPILDGEGKFRAVFAGEVNLTSMSALMTERIGLGETGETYLINNYNFALTQLRKDDKRGSKKFIYTRAVENCLDKRKTSVSSQLEYTDYAGDTALGVCMYLPEREVGIIAKIDKEEVYAYSKKLWNTTFAIALIIAAIFLAIAFLFARTISKPIRVLTEGSLKIGRGDLGHRIEIHSKDEIGSLAASFNNMAQSLSSKISEHKRTEEELTWEIAERKRWHEALVELTKGLERSNQELEQFAYVASHDLQEPLRMVASFTQLLAQRYKGKLGSDADEFIAYAVDGAIRMQELINDLLTYSRVGTRGKDFEPTDCKAVLERILENLQKAVEESGAKITHDPLPTVMADDVQLRELFQNLIGNAIKFRNEKPPRVHVSAEKSGNEWIFSVCDNGIGIDAELTERIFIIFQRLHKRGEYPGTGIGLAICKKVVERHGGHIWVESKPGKGSTFYFTIPLAGGNSHE